MTDHDEISVQGPVGGPDGVEVRAKFSIVPELVRKSAGLDLKECVHSRAEVAFRLTKLTGRDVTVAMIEAYVAPTKPHRFPLELIPAWIEVTGSRRVLDTICDQVGLALATEEEQAFAELGRTRLRDEKLTRRLWEKI